jgi:site-specific DNA-methyltransferase (adenine-specific)
VWQFPRARGGSHPAEKPIALIRRWIADFTDPGDLILDPFMGSGTVLRAAKDLGRQKGSTCLTYSPLSREATLHLSSKS